MAKTYKWKINALDVNINEGNDSDVVYCVHWSYSVEEDGTTAHIIGTHSLEYDSENFVAYEDITEETVIGWLEEGLDVDSMKEGLDNTLAEKITPKVKTYSNPFPSLAE